jgi:glutathione S-transferase
MLTFYDIDNKRSASTVDNDMVQPEFVVSHSKQSWSPNTLKTLLALRHKGIPFAHTWVSYPDIEPLLKSKDVSPNKAIGDHPYTLPAIEADDGRVVTGSMAIATYLESAFPDGPLLHPHHSLPLAVLLEHSLHELSTTVYSLVFPGCVGLLDDRGAEYFKRTREAKFGPLDAIWEDKERQAESMGKAPGLVRKLASVLEPYAHEGPFALGKDRSYVDILLVSRLEYIRLCNKGLYDSILLKEPALKRLYESCSDIL